MTLLLDTHVAVWAVTGDAKLSAAVRRRIHKAQEVCVSVVSLWEIAVKHALTRRRDAMPFSARVALAEFERAGFVTLPVLAAHAVAVDALPPLHADPFDRLLVAQAMTEPMHLLTRDERLVAYSPLVMLA